MTVKINTLELENVKRVRALRLTPTADGLTVIGGNNAQGKTSVLDALAYALGGERYRPTNLQHDGGVAPAKIELTLSNGLVVTRSGKNAALKVVDPSGAKGGQRLLDAFIDELAINLPKFLAMSGKEKANVLLRILGIADQLEALEKEERTVYQEREAFGRIADQKAKYFAELPWHADVPETPLSAAGLIQQSQAIMQRNAERQQARQQIEQARQNVATKQRRVDELKQMLEQATADLTAATSALAAADTDVPADESTDEIQRNIENMEEVNAKIRANLDKEKAKADAEDHKQKYNHLTAKVEDVRRRRMDLLQGAQMPLAGLSIENSELTYQGQAWDCMSSMERIRAAVAIVRKLKPECGFVLLDGLESFDLNQLEEMDEWLTREGLQAIATRVSTGEECSIIIEDGIIAGTQTTDQSADADWQTEGTRHDRNRNQKHAIESCPIWTRGHWQDDGGQ